MSIMIMLAAALLLVSPGKGDAAREGTAVSRQPEKIERTEEEWRRLLTPGQYAVLREGATECAFTGALDEQFGRGTYRCAGCGAPLFGSDAKFHSGSGWPSFYEALSAAAVDTSVDRSLAIVRTEVRCAGCGGHLGHVFGDGPPPTGLRFCINSVALRFEPVAGDLPGTAR